MTHQLAKGKSRRRAWLGSSCTLALMLKLAHPQRAGAEDHVEFKYELYKENNHRIEVNTGLFQFEKSLTPSLTLKGEMVYDSISGASPTGGPAPAGSKQVPLATLTDVRTAGALGLNQRWGNHTLTPQIAYSTENDYDSWGISLSDAIDFNQKNTTLSLGVSHNFDTIYKANSPYLPTGAIKKKDSTDGLIGITQLLGPKTILTVNATYGYVDGYLTDPYKGIRFDSFPDVDGTFIFGERRPGHKSREIAYVSLRQFITPADASVELAYRFYHDSFDITAHTVSLSWLQKIGTHFTIEPSVRYYEQSAASFYHSRVAPSVGDPGFHGANFPSYYSADYRLSSLNSWTYGVKATYKFNEHFWLDAAYKRYEMFGQDHATSASAYPKANVFTVGLTVWF